MRRGLVLRMASLAFFFWFLGLGKAIVKHPENCRFYVDHVQVLVSSV